MKGNFIIVPLTLHYMGRFVICHNDTVDKLQTPIFGGVDQKTTPPPQDIVQRKPIKLNMKQALAMNQIILMYTLAEAKNVKCKEQANEFGLSLREFKPWALKMFDASSKLQSGILAGNLFEFGSFRQCIQIYENTTVGEIRGKHCTIKIYPHIDVLRKILEYKGISKRRFDKVYTFVAKSAVAWSVCVPDSCEVDDILYHFEKLIYVIVEGLMINVTLNKIDCYTIFSDKPLSNMELGIIIALSSFLLVVVVSTIVDLYSSNEEANKFINIFSAYGNTKQIFSKGKRGKSDLDCVHGIRFLSTCYVVIGHRYLMMMFFPVINSLQIMDWILTYRSTAITGGTLCVDTFFMISGMLVTVGYFNELEKKGKISWILFYLYRFMRITPPLAIVVLIYSTLIHHLGSGPLWNDMLSIIQKPCQEYWWATLLHIQNYVHPFPLCMTQAWYLTCDMQYYFLSPLILIPLSKFRTFGIIIYLIIYILSVSIGFYLGWINKYNGGVPITNQLFSTKYFQQHYIAPHARASTYIIGMGLGYFIYRHKGSKIKISYPLAVIGWMISIATMLASLVGCHTFHLETHDYNIIESTIYIAFSRSSWTFGLVWMVWACINGYGGPINAVLSSHIFRVLGRISYSIYLWHMLLQYLMSGAAKQPGYFSDFTALYEAFSDLFIMIVIGFGFTICFEFPLVKFLTMILRVNNGKIKKIEPNNKSGNA